VDIEDAHVGRRVREVRQWRGKSLEVTAGLAGMSASCLSLIERGRRPVTTRSTLEKIAHALRVSPAELTGKPYVPSDEVSAAAAAHMAAMRDVLTG
jgi:transcriptional regulator with XRE-family HTH domain